MGDRPVGEELDERRRDLEERVADLRDALSREFGWAPRAATWLLPMLAGAAGLAAGLLLRRSSRRRLRRATRRELGA